MKSSFAVLFALLTAGSLSPAQPAQSSASTTAEPRNVSYCEIARDPAGYNRQLVRLTAFVTHGFEDFALVQPDCDSTSEHFTVWVTYGGRAESNTIYCCPGEGGEKTRSQPLTVDGVPIPLLEDDEFQKFTELLKKERSTIVRATVVGRFFPGEKETLKGSTYWQGFGHMGCCSLFVIQQVEWFAPHDRIDLDYASDGGWYETGGCQSDSYRYVKDVLIAHPDANVTRAIAEQKLANSGANAWAFDNPERVAVDSLKPFYEGRAPALRLTAKSPARQVFQWRDGKKCIEVVVARPYWLSFYASSQAVVWVTTNIKEFGSDWPLPVNK